MSWRDEAACKGQPLELFDPQPGVNPSVAKRMCRECPVRFDCAADAVNEGDWETVRGGMSSRRRRMSRRVLGRIVETGDREAFDHLARFSRAEFQLLMDREAS